MRERLLAVLTVGLACVPSAWADAMADHDQQAGALTVVPVCTACHSLKYVTYGDLLTLGVSTQLVDEWRGEKDLLDSIARQTPEDIAKETYGVVPPDLSVMAIAREGGADYIYRMLTGFYQRPDGTIDNHAFPGIRMPDILGISASDDPQTRAQLEQTAHAAAAFLEWAADPKAQQRMTLGYYVLGYLLALTALLYLLKREIWSDLK